MKFSQITKNDPYEYANFFPGPGFYDTGNLILILSIKIYFHNDRSNKKDKERKFCQSNLY